MSVVTIHTKHHSNRYFQQNVSELAASWVCSSASSKGTSVDNQRGLSEDGGHSTRQNNSVRALWGTQNYTTVQPVKITRWPRPFYRLWLVKDSTLHSAVLAHRHQHL